MSVFTPSGGGQAGGGTASTQLVPTGTPSSIYAEVLGVAAGATEVVLSYTVPAGVTSYLLRVTVGGENIANYTLTLNSQTFAKERTYYGGSLTATIQVGESLIDAVKLVAGDTLVVSVENFRPSVASFESRLQVTTVGGT